MKPPKRPRYAPKKVSQQPGPAKKIRKGKQRPIDPEPSTRGASSSDKNLQITQNTPRNVDNVQVSRTVTASNLSVASGPVINIVADANDQEPPFVPFMIQDEMAQESPSRSEVNTLDRLR